MSAEATGYVWEQSPYTGPRFIIHLAVADVVNDTYGNEFWMSTDNMALKTRTSRRTVQRAFDEFVENGDLVIVRSATQRTPTTYRFVFRNHEPVDNSDSGVSHSHSGVSASPLGVSASHLGVSPRHPNSNNSIELKEHMINEVDQPDLFSDFWEQYPRKVGKQKAEKAFNKLDGSTQQQALEGIVRYSQFWEQQQTVLEYIPHPTTWINAARWEDELTEPAPPISDTRQYDQPERPQCDICDSTGYITIEDDQHRSWAHPCVQCTSTS